MNAIPSAPTPITPAQIASPKSMPLPNIKAAFVGFGEVNTPRDIVERLCDGARQRLERQNIERRPGPAPRSTANRSTC